MKDYVPFQIKDLERLNSFLIIQPKFLSKSRFIEITLAYMITPWKDHLAMVTSGILWITVSPHNET